MESPLDPHTITRIDPSGLQRGDRPSWIEMIGLSEGKQIPFRVDSAEAQLVPFGMSFERLKKRGIEWDGASFACLRFAFADREELLLEIDLVPFRITDLAVPHSRIEGQHQRRICSRRSALT